MRPSFKLELDEARRMIAAAIRKSGEIGVLETVCITDEGGYPLALERMDGARVTGPQIAWNKAFTAAGHKRSTHLFNQAPNGPALPGNEAFGIQWSFEGGGNGEQDTACGIAALEALQELLGPKHRVLVQADIKM